MDFLSTLVVAFLILVSSTQGAHHDKLFKKINTDGPVCFKAKGDQPAVITYKGHERVLNGIKLVHVSGKLSYDGRTKNFFGCGKRDHFNIFITDVIDNVVFPRKDIVKVMAFPRMRVYVRSEGCSDPGIVGCGQARMIVNGVDYAPGGRGFQVVVLDAMEGKILGTRRFDSYGQRSEALKAYHYLRSVKGHKIVLVAIADEAWNQGSHFPIDRELIRLGAKGPIIRQLRSSLALIGYAGRKRPRWMRFGQNPPSKGPTTVNSKIPIIPGGKGKSYWYEMTNRDCTSKTMLFADVSRPFLLSRNQQLKVWYGEDLDDVNEMGNAGRACVDVYAWLA
ncbi:uncharacterized protein LOC5509862 [Nematostella vectensis]|uniref:uncharacterized protein LOC5509862 n=1 Tax=Nematostella vectensis TaxID=45351 RepID=UPI00207713C7|nr:uncharacterized protein LOC5509862 [Nematostella vectensis]